MGFCTEVTSIVMHTIKDATRRKRNVIISGLLESAQHNDIDLVKKLCSTELDFCPSIAHPGTRRLGTRNDNKPRRLLVSLENEVQARDLLTRSRNLRNSSNNYIANNVYINPDLSPEDAKAAFERRQSRRAGATRTENADPGPSTGHQSRGPGYSVWNSSRMTHRQPSSNNNLIVITGDTVSFPPLNSAPSTANNGHLGLLDPNAMDFRPSCNDVPVVNDPSLPPSSHGSA
jgi:hypothetical protein